MVSSSFVRTNICTALQQNSHSDLQPRFWKLVTKQAAASGDAVLHRLFVRLGIRWVLSSVGAVQELRGVWLNAQPLCARAAANVVTRGKRENATQGVRSVGMRSVKMRWGFLRPS